MKNKTSQSGFTLIELIAVMVILGILAAVIIPRITTITSGAYESNVRAMYGLIKNEVNAQAIKAAMTGGSQGHLERYPDPCNTDVDYYLDRWVDDYDADMWTSFAKSSVYDNANGLSNSCGALFMYHPHGKPNAAISGTFDTPNPGGGSASLEDFYWIYYAPRTSASGSAAGRQLDGFVMAAWKGGPKMTEALKFDGQIVQGGTTTQIDEEEIADLTYKSGN